MFTYNLKELHVLFVCVIMCYILVDCHFNLAIVNRLSTKLILLKFEVLIVRDFSNYFVKYGKVLDHLILKGWQMIKRKRDCSLVTWKKYEHTFSSRNTQLK